MSDYARAGDLRAGDVVGLLWGGPEPVEITAVAPWHGPLRFEEYDQGRARWLVTGWRWNAHARAYEQVVGLHADRPSFRLYHRRPEETPCPSPTSPATTATPATSRSSSAAT